MTAHIHMIAPRQAIVPNEYANAAASDFHAYILPSLFALCPELGPNTRVLDLGCGNESVTAKVARCGCKILWIDMSESGIHLARQNYPAARFEVLPADAHVLENL